MRRQGFLPLWVSLFVADFNYLCYVMLVGGTKSTKRDHRLRQADDARPRLVSLLVQFNFTLLAGEPGALRAPLLAHLT